MLRSTATLKELQEFLTSNGCVHVTTIPCLLHISGLWGWGRIMEVFSYKIKAQQHFAKSHLKSGKMYHGLINFFCHNSIKYVWHKP